MIFLRILSFQALLIVFIQKSPMLLTMIGMSSLWSVFISLATGISIFFQLLLEKDYDLQGELHLWVMPFYLFCQFKLCQDDCFEWSYPILLLNSNTFLIFHYPGQGLVCMRSMVLVFPSNNDHLFSLGMRV